MTIECLESIFNQNATETFEIILVDNNSTDDSAIEIEKKFPQIQLIPLQENIGFARANNLASKSVKSKRILLLNPDTIILDRAIDRLSQFAETHPDALLWGGRTVFGPGDLNPTSCWRFMSVWSIFCFATGLSTLFKNIPVFNTEAYGNWTRDSIREVDFITGCFLLIDRPLWEKLGGFDEKFFMYAEEADLCYRARQLGARPLFTPGATIIHYGGASETVFYTKVIRLFSGKISFLYKHWNPFSRFVGVRLFELSVFMRTIGYASIAKFTRSKKHKHYAHEWKVVWINRDKWKTGYTK